MSSRGVVVRRLARMMSSLVYREIDIYADPALDEAGGPTIAVSNHFGGLADGILLVDTLPRMPRVVARDVIFNIPIVGQIASAAGGIPVHRAVDRGPGSNDETFASCYEALAQDELILIFPEGVTQDVPHIAPVKTGAARIALGAQATGVTDIRIVPVGVHYEAKAVFRSRVLVHVGAPLLLDEWTARHQVDGGADDHAAVTALTEEITARLQHAAPNYPDWPTAHAYAAAAEIPLHDVDNRLTPLRYGNVSLLAEELREGDADGQVLAQAETYRQALIDSGATDVGLARHGEAGAAAQSQSGWRDVLLSLLLLPYALVGALIGLIPWLLVQAVRLLPAAPAVRATLTPAVATLTFGAEWVFLVWRAASIDGARAGFLALLLTPFFLVTTVFVAERLTLAWRRRRATRLPDAAQVAALQQQRDALSETIWGRWWN
jgi:glycerol-3-phosphate O-acyltransferase/dihydroxyacetone phosphate acyltransferase